MCIDIVEIWFGIANEQIASDFSELNNDMIMTGIIVLRFP